MFRPTKPLRLPEFTALLAALSATAAFSIDAMLPALPQIAADLTPGDVNRAQLVLTAFVLGMGLGVLFVGPISDAIGRKPTISWSIGLFIIGAIAAAFAPTLEWLLAARVLQGVGVAGPRVVSLALIRDRYEGREMARVTSFVMMVFMLAPAVAPSIGKLVSDSFGWHGVFWCFVVIGVVDLLWLNARQPETLAPENRSKVQRAPLIAAAQVVISNRDVLRYTLVMTLGFGQMFALLSSAPQIYGDTFDRAETFPLWFALMAVLASSATMINSAIVVRVGMRKIVSWGYMMQICSAGAYVALNFLGLIPEALAFYVFYIWSVSVFFIAGLTFGNLNALAMQQMGHVAGMAASIIAGASTVGAVLIAAPIGLLFDGTAIPAAIGALVCSAIAWLMMRRTPMS